METKEIEVACPCCESVLLVDVRTRQVLRWHEAGDGERESDEERRARGEVRWSRANENVGGRLDNAADKFEQGLSREKSRERDLDDLFRQANERLKGKDSGDDDA